MKTQNILFLLCSGILLFNILACSDDDAGSGNFNESCCNNAPLVIQEDSFNLYVPNAFTPNGDGFNDVFRPFGNDGIVSVVTLSIQNEGGGVVFESNNFMINSNAGAWNGTLPDGTLNSDIYNYDIIVEAVDGNEYSYSGTICCRAENDPACVDNEMDCRYATQHDGIGGLDETLPSFEICE